MTSNSLFLAHFSFSASQDFSSNADSFRSLYWTYRRLLSPNFEDFFLSFRMGGLMKNPKFEARRGTGSDRQAHGRSLEESWI